MLERIFLILPLLIALHGCGKPNAAERAVEFEERIMRGERLELSEWFAPGAGDTDFIKLYGGPEKLAADSKKRADAEQGVKAIEIVESRALPSGEQVVSVRTTFNSGKTAESQETWAVIAGKWKIVPPTAGESSP